MLLDGALPRADMSCPFGAYSQARDQRCSLAVKEALKGPQQFSPGRAHTRCGEAPGRECHGLFRCLGYRVLRVRTAGGDLHDVSVTGHSDHALHHGLSGHLHGNVERNEPLVHDTALLGDGHACCELHGRHRGVSEWISVRQHNLLLRDCLHKCQSHDDLPLLVRANLRFPVLPVSALLLRSQRTASLIGIKSSGCDLRISRRDWNNAHPHRGQSRRPRGGHGQFYAMTPELRARLQEWLLSDDPVQRRHAIWRLAQPDILADESAPIPLAESLPLLRLVNLCLYRSRDAACGCTGHRCALRSDLVTHLDCLDCARTYGHS